MNYDILFFAFRYALSRQSYAVSIVADEILRQSSNIPHITKELMVREIKEAIASDHISGFRCDVEKWKMVLKALTLTI